MRSAGERSLQQFLNIYDRNQPQADPPCPARIPYPYIAGSWDTLAFRLRMRTIGRCGKPLDHEGDHALGGCGCPLWNFDEQRCYCEDVNGWPACGACY